MATMTSEQISTAIQMTRANSPDTKAYVNSLKLKAPAVEGLLLSALLAEIKAGHDSKIDPQDRKNHMERVSVYNLQVAMMFAKAMNDKDKAEMKEMIMAINKFDGIIAIAPGELKFGINYMVAEIFGNERWMKSAAQKLKMIVDLNLGLKIAAENYLQEMGRNRIN